MDSYLSRSSDYIEDNERVEKLYPDCYRRIYPHICYIVKMMHSDEVEEMPEGALERMIEDILKRGDVMKKLPSGHNASTMRDIVRILLIRELYDGNSEERYGFYCRNNFYNDRYRCGDYLSSNDNCDGNGGVNGNRNGNGNSAGLMRNRPSGREMY